MLSDTPTFMDASCAITTSVSGCAIMVERLGVPDTSDTLPDLLCDGLDVVFIGINPSLFSAAQGHYFARRSNRFWPCFSRSVLSEAARRALGVTRLEPQHDQALPACGFGFTDLVKRPTARAGDLRPQELSDAVAALVARLERRWPCIACFHGVTGFRHVLRALAPVE